MEVECVSNNYSFMSKRCLDDFIFFNGRFWWNFLQIDDLEIVIFILKSNK